MLIASDHVRATPRPIPGKLYPSLVKRKSSPHRRFPLPLRMRVIDDDSVRTMIITYVDYVTL